MYIRIPLRLAMLILLSYSARTNHRRNLKVCGRPSSRSRDSLGKEYQVLCTDSRDQQLVDGSAPFEEGMCGIGGRRVGLAYGTIEGRISL